MAGQLNIGFLKVEELEEVLVLGEGRGRVGVELQGGLVEAETTLLFNYAGVLLLAAQVEAVEDGHRSRDTIVQAVYLISAVGECGARKSGVVDVAGENVAGYQADSRKSLGPR